MGDIQKAQADADKSKRPRFLVIGAGSRGNAYARAVTQVTSGIIHSVAETDDFKRREFGKTYIWGSEGSPSEGQQFGDWKEWLAWEQERRRKKEAGEGDEHVGVDGVFVCTLDETHAEILLAIAPLQLHILCEKPLATSLKDCMSIYNALLPDGPQSKPNKIFSIGHVLRYSPHNTLLRKLLLTDSVIGDIVSLEHTEPVGWWHFSHSYVRGNWRRQTPEGVGSLLTKSCHDIDFILWLLCSPPPGTPLNHPHHLPKSISSMGTLTHFRRSRKPALAGSATNCLTCPAERSCIYSSLNIYRDINLAKHKLRWPLKILSADIEDIHTTAGHSAAESHLLKILSEDYDKSTTPDSEIASRPWFGRCVYESDNNVNDDQVVTIQWDDDEDNTNLPNRTSKTATFHMIAPTESQCDRRGRVYGTTGELTYDSHSISVYSFATRSTTTYDVPKQPEDESKAHGGGDYGLARGFVRAVEAAEDGWSVERAQGEFVGCTLEEVVRSHAVVFAAEEARREERVVRWKEWWEGKVGELR
ncbi:hypothetical protein FQN54_003958 [Arachnomyces sp. PD_36]|nr:hypothetical protein FQN54_003958 [Arachnomyces sp. PD_36]